MIVYGSNKTLRNWYGERYIKNIPDVLWQYWTSRSLRLVSGDARAYGGP